MAVAQILPSQGQTEPSSAAHPERRKVIDEEAERQRETIRQLAREDARRRGDTYIDPFGGSLDITMSQ
jgi:hypothetical protein